jgi:hypothetical protein
MDNMLKEDKEKLKELMMAYPAKDLMTALSEVALEVAGDLSDACGGHTPPIAKDYVLLGATLEEMAIGRPFLV